MKISRTGAIVGTVLLVLGLLGCSADRPAPVGSLEPGERQPVPEEGIYRVEKGDTLYSIAWRYGMDFRQLAQWNRIGPPYTIYPNQRLQLRPQGEGSSTPPAVASATRERARPARPSGRPAPKPEPPVSADIDSDARGEPDGPLRWAWPLDGEVVQTFQNDDRLRQGVRIASAEGRPVQAAEAGKVVYSGSRLPGYGQLIIIKHNKNYLSAYGFNRKLLVQEGDEVARGAQVAEVGRSPDGKSLLHFEIRRQGTAVDPLGLLPRR